MSLAIKHQNSNTPFPRATIAVNLPTREVLYNALVNEELSLHIPLGVCFVHPSEQYNKKLGTEKVLTRMNPLTFPTLQSVEFRGLRVVFHFTGVTADYRPGKKVTKIQFGVSYYGKGNKTRLEYAFVGD